MICAFTAFVFSAALKPIENNSNGELKTLVKWMTGDFSSQAQSQRDSDYYDIRLHIKPIWTSNKGEHWLYVEQAMASAQDKPYRQRIYKVERNGSKGFKSIVYTLPTPEKWIGAYKNIAVFNDLKPSELSPREGCTVFLGRKTNAAFAGSTNEADCESNLRGAKYATSKVTITKHLLKSWDQGFDENNKQVWGAKKGGYEFVKLSDHQ
jgi:hypothetical protein